MYTEEAYGKLTSEECEILSGALKGQISKLPLECRQYVGSQRSRGGGAGDAARGGGGGDGKAEASIAFDGLPPGQAAAGKAARVKGQQTHAALQRRYTNSFKPRNDP